MFCSEYDNFKYYHNDYIFHDSILRGRSEPYPYDYSIVEKYLKLFPHKNRCYVDIGAHIGTTIMPFLKLYNNALAYEPNDESYSFLCRNIEENKLKDRVITSKDSLGDVTTKGRLIHHGAQNSGCYYFTNDDEKSNINCIKMDDDPNIYKRYDIDFIKIDVEGFELSVLKGAEKTILKNKPLLALEINGLSEKHYNVKSEDIYSYLYSLGAIIFDYNESSSNVFFYFPNDTLCLNEKRIFCFWTGNNELTPNRKNCLNTIENVTLVTTKNLDNYILKSHPLHKAYKYLSETHKADYLRTYFMHFYGGGYSDIKIQSGSWNQSFDLMINNKDFYACGYKEIGPDGVPNANYKDKWESLIGNGCYIFRPNTDFTRDWYNQMIQKLDEKLTLLQNNPSKHPRDCVEHFPNTKYPLFWSEILGHLFHPVCYKYRDRLLYTLPTPFFHSYL